MIGKDGANYNSYNELVKANAKWEQQERQNRLLEEQNRLMSEENEDRRFNELLKRVELRLSIYVNFR